jgi:hypothetical protein
MKEKDVDDLATSIGALVEKLLKVIILKDEENKDKKLN